MKRRKLFTATLLGLLLIMINPSVSEAKPKLISSKAYLTEGGCLVIVNTYEHRFLFWTWETTETESPNCDAYNS